VRALVCDAFGRLDGLRVGELPEPSGGPGQLLVQVQAAGVNYADSIMVAGHYQTRPEPPFAPGLECAGTVLTVGEGCTGFSVGDRVMALVDHSGFAERAVVRQSEAMLVPAGMSLEEAAAFPIAYCSSHVAIRWQAGLADGESMLVLGASGGVGLAAVELGKAIGARVIAAASTEAKLGLAAEHGADELVNYGSGDLRRQVLDLTGPEGVHVVFDPVGGELFGGALSSLGWGGRYLLVGFVAGVPQIPANRLLVKHRSALGSSLRYFRFRRPDLLARTWSELANWHASGLLRPHVYATFPLADSPAAIRMLTERRAQGKVVVTLP